MDYSNIFTSMQAEVTLIAVIVLLFLYDLIAGERGRRRFSAVACGLLALQVAVNVVPGTPGEVFGGMFQYVPMHSIVKSVLTVGTLIVFLQADAWLRRGDTAHKQGEFYILTLSTLLGMYLMVGAGLSGGVRQVQALFGRGGGEVHPLRPLRQRADALWNLVLLRDDRGALF